jgi:hypothetical protein
MMDFLSTVLAAYLGVLLGLLFLALVIWVLWVLTLAVIFYRAATRRAGVRAMAARMARLPAEAMAQRGAMACRVDPPSEGQTHPLTGDNA